MFAIGKRRGLGVAASGVTIAFVLSQLFLSFSAKKESLSHPPNARVFSPDSVGQIYDRSAHGLLFSKNRSSANLEESKDSGRDLWIQISGENRYIATNVISASFSPDGEKVAYVTSGSELFVETIGGKRLARLVRASDPNWRDDSAAVTFSVVAAVDYPGLQQTVVYNLGSGQMTRLPNGE